MSRPNDPKPPRGKPAKAAPAKGESPKGGAGGDGAPTGHPHPAPVMKAPESGVKVRMYCHGLGDCFLLAFPTRAKDKPFYMMIDCGVILGTEKPEDRMGAVLRDIKESTGGHIDLLVATHEHWDHLSGFVQARDFFEREFTVDHLWLAWTEDPSDKFAQALRDHRHKTLDALRKAVARMRGMAAEQLKAADDPKAQRDARAIRETADRVEGVLGFFGMAGGHTTGDALKVIREHARSLGFRHPGEAPIALPGVEGVRVYVLGPPSNDLIKKSNPTKTGKEVYEEAFALTPETAFLAALERALGAGDADLDARSSPFDRCQQLGVEEAKVDPRFKGFFRENYGFEAASPHGPAWRRIDDDWLGASSPLALQLDSDTNNTSLALAIELVDSGRVLLFPGDAQVGNWLSWEALSWRVAGSPHRVTAADLLRRTVLYKVGHHASHNATLRAKGLELMQSPDLVAMIPVDHDMAVKKRWDMPFPALLERLAEKSSGRVIRIDRGVPERPAHVNEDQWESFRARVESRDIACDDPSLKLSAIDYTVPGER